MKLLPQLQPRIFQRVRIVTPAAPARSNGHDDGVHEGDLPQVLENLRVFVVLNAIADGLQPYPRSGLAGSDRTRRIEEYTVPRSSGPAAARSGIHIVPTADGVPGGPAAGAVVKNSRPAFRPLQEPGLDPPALGWLAHLPCPR